MGQNQLFTKEQELVLAKIASHSYFRENFYFTGGTALSYFYLQHRYSDDLDFFSSDKINTQVILTLMTDLSRELNFKFTEKFVEVVQIFDLQFANNTILKVDFSYYPYKQVEKGQKWQGLWVDSLLDIAINKLITINQRTNAKDFVDLYFLLTNHFTIWDLLDGAEVKFKLKIDQVMLAADFLKAENFTILPKMIKPLSLKELRYFYRHKAKEISKKFVE